MTTKMTSTKYFNEPLASFLRDRDVLDAAENYCANTHYYLNHSQIRRRTNLVLAFNWQDTKEGSIFWYHIWKDYTTTLGNNEFHPDD
jgi:hypothetical protein